MIELCTKRRMVVLIVVLGILTVLILILEEKITSDRHYWSQSPSPVPHNYSGHRSVQENDQFKDGFMSASSSVDGQNGCWVKEEFKITEECSPCSQFEISSNTPSICEITGLKEKLQCNISGSVYRSCSSVTSQEKQRFWIFEGLMLLICVLSMGFAKFRTSQIERAAIKRIERRLASGL